MIDKKCQSQEMIEKEILNDLNPFNAWK